MSPTSCRCSTPRWPPAAGGGDWAGRHRSSRAGVPPAARVGPARGAPAAASPPMGSPPEYSPALRWVTTGFGMGPGGSTALSATGAPRPARRAPPAGRPRATTDDGRRLPFAYGGGEVGRWGETRRRRRTPAARSRRGTRPRGGHCKGLPSAMSTARLRSVARRPPAASQPGRLPGALPDSTVGRLVLGRDSRLDAFSGSPVRT